MKKEESFMREEYINGVAGACKNLMGGLEEIEAMARRMNGAAEEAAYSNCFSQEEKRTFQMVLEIAAKMKREIGQDADELQQAISKLRRIDS